MGLATYDAKRDFEATPEPEGGKPSPGGRAFCVQKHAARRLHFDLRLEHDGVLLSWAVTRGPSPDPAQKRLAVRTEDHPMDYAGFEGVIPDGYGKGTVLLWDRGHWEPLHDVADGLDTGMLHFRLHGARLRGGWALIRMKGRPADRGRENWLLVKEADAAAREDADALTEGYLTSVASGRDLEAIAAGAPPIAVRRGVRPKFRPPMLATLADELPGEGWLHEPKLDGYRAQIAIGRGGAVIFSRSGQDWTDRFHGLAVAAEAITARSALIDGEVLAEADETFSGLQQALAEGRALVFYAFDLLALDGADLAPRPLTDRRAALEALIAPLPPRGALRLAPQIAGHGAALLGAICGAGGEGVVAKRPDAPWRSGRGRAWLKLKCVRRSEFVVSGYVRSDKKGRPFASLILGTYDDGALVHRGRVGTGFDASAFSRLAPVVARTRRTSPFAAPLSAEARRSAVWLEPEAVAEVRYAELTSEGILRHASFQGLREDKPAHEVTGQDLPLRRAAGAPLPTDAARKAAASATITAKNAARRGRAAAMGEKTRAAPAGGGASAAPGPRPSRQSGLGPAESGGPGSGPGPRGDESHARTMVARASPKGTLMLSGIRITSPARVVFPDRGLTKGALAEYYAAVAERLLEHAGDRPLSLIRCPDGIAGECFFQKHGRQGFPDAVPRWQHRGEEWLYLNGVRALLASVQMGTTEFHVQGVRRDRPDRPDRMVLDLDPDEGLAFADVRAAAFEIRTLVEALKLPAGVMVTGGKGLHVVVPLKRTQPLKTVSLFAQTIATLLAERAPDRFTANIRKARRNGRIFIDWQRNTRGATAICPWSVRARPGAPVALPVSWDELAGLEAGNAFDTAAAVARAGSADPLAELAPAALTVHTLGGLAAA